jgi:hypothetical protein
LKQQMPEAAALNDRLGKIDARLGALSKDRQDVDGRLEALAASQKSAQDGLDKRISALEQRVGAVEGAQKQLALASAKVTEAARLQAARAALDAGTPLGTIANAPPALAKFATENPPTQAELRLEFPAAAKAALEASRPTGADRPFLNRVWSQAQELVTVRQGDRVIVGDPAAGVLARAQNSLNAGDLQGAVNAVSSLSGPAAEPMAGWLGKARALLAARGALDQMTPKA